MTKIFYLHLSRARTSERLSCLVLRKGSLEKDEEQQKPSSLKMARMNKKEAALA